MDGPAMLATATSTFARNMAPSSAPSASHGRDAASGPDAASAPRPGRTACVADSLTPSRYGSDSRNTGGNRTRRLRARDHPPAVMVGPKVSRYFSISTPSLAAYAATAAAPSPVSG